MTINGPAPIHTRIFHECSLMDQQCEKYIIENNLKDEINRIIESRYEILVLPKYTGTDGLPVIPKGRIKRCATFRQ